MKYMSFFAEIFAGHLKNEPVIYFFIHFFIHNLHNLP